MYKRRYLVESLIGSLKGRWGGYKDAQMEGMAYRLVWGTLLWWNMGALLRSGKRVAILFLYCVLRVERVSYR